MALAISCQGPLPSEFGKGDNDVVLYSSALTVTLNPTADVHVRDGSNASTNFGTATTFECKLSSTAGNNRDAYLRFSLSSVTGTVHRARLRLFGSASNNTAQVPVVAHVLPDNSFSETGVTWNSKPYFRPIELARIKVNTTTAQWYELDVTGYVRQKKRAGAATIELALHSPAVTDPAARFNSRENASNKPQLMIDTATALFVVGSTTLVAGDVAAKARLEQLGYAVTVKTGATATSADASGKTLVVISSSVNPTDVNTKFRNVTVPVVNWETLIFDDMKLTGTVSGTDFGTVTNQDRVAITNAAHALAAGRQGTVTVTTTLKTFGWGKVGSSALKIATLTSDANRATVFGYEAGASMVGMTAPARRVGLFLQDSTPASLGQGGWALFDAAITWAAGARPFTTKKVYVLNYDPFMFSTGQRASQYFGWPNAQQITQEFITDMAEASGDYVRYQLAGILNLDDWPLFEDGFRYTDQEFRDGYNHTGGTVFHEGTADYSAIIAAHNLDSRVGTGELDDVFIAAPPGNGFFESRMVGPAAFYANAPEMRRAIPRNYFVEYIDISRRTALFQHGYIHRMEWILRHVYGELYGPSGSEQFLGNWNTDPYGPACLWSGFVPSCTVSRVHFWDNFTITEGVAQNARSQGDATAVAGIGTGHHLPNAVSQSLDNYNYGQIPERQLGPVTSSADDWLYNFPNLTGETRPVRVSEWSIPYPDSWDGPQYGFMLWWYNHVPRVSSRHTDGVLNNWWDYAVNFNDYPEALQE